MFGANNNTWGPTIESMGLLPGEDCAFSYDCLSQCCSENIGINTIQTLGYKMYDSIKNYSQEEIQGMVAGQLRILNEGEIFWADYGVKEFLDKESGKRIPEYLLTYFPQFTETEEGFKIQFNYPVC